MDLPKIDLASVFAGLLPDPVLLEQRWREWQAMGNLLRRLRRLVADINGEEATRSEEDDAEGELESLDQ